MNDFDEPTNPEARMPLHPEVVEWAERHAQAVRNYKRPADVIADADRLVELAKGVRQ